MSVADDKLEDLDFEALEQAVRQSPKGNWFLDEYARRLRSGETTNILDAIAKLERVITSSGAVAALPQAQSPMQARQLRYFRKDEELFVEPQQAPALAVVEPDPAPAATAPVAEAPEPPAAEPVPAEPAPAEPAPADAKVPAAEQRGARLKILRIEQPAVVTTGLPPATDEVHVPAASQATVISQHAADEHPARKQRIIITRQAAAEDLAIPLLEDEQQGTG